MYLFCVFQAAGASPDLNTVKSIMKLAWSASACSFHLLQAPYEDIHDAFEKVIIIQKRSLFKFSLDFIVKIQ